MSQIPPEAASSGSVVKMNKFPDKLGDLSNKTFEETWTDCPKWVEFVRSTWNGDSCTGVFKDFFDFVKRKCKSEQNLGEHLARCIEFCKNKQLVSLPRYMLKYVAD